MDEAALLVFFVCPNQLPPWTRWPRALWNNLAGTKQSFFSRCKSGCADPFTSPWICCLTQNSLWTRLSRECEKCTSPYGWGPKVILTHFVWMSLVEFAAEDALEASIELHDSRQQFQNKTAMHLSVIKKQTSWDWLLSSRRTISHTIFFLNYFYPLNWFLDYRKRKEVVGVGRDHSS